MCIKRQGQALISLPKVEREFQSYLFSQSLQGTKSTVEDNGGELLGGHTFEARSLVNKPYSLGIDISLTVQGILKKINFINQILLTLY